MYKYSSLSDYAENPVFEGDKATKSLEILLRKNENHKTFIVILSALIFILMVLIYILYVCTLSKHI